MDYRIGDRFELVTKSHWFQITRIDGQQVDVKYNTGPDSYFQISSLKGFKYLGNFSKSHSFKTLYNKLNEI